MGSSLSIVIFLPLVVGLICGAISSAIAGNKNRSVGGFFAAGFFLGIIGIIIAAVVSPGRPPAPAGMAAVVCPRCNARQNVPMRSADFQCWQCHQYAPVPSIATPARPRTEEQKASVLANVSISISSFGVLLLFMSVPWFIKSPVGVPMSIWGPPVAVGIVGLALGLAVLARGSGLGQRVAKLARVGMFIGGLPTLVTVVLALIT